MRNLNVNCDWGIFLHAFTYSSNFLLFSVTIAVASVLCVWLYEKPLIYKLFFKKSEHANSLSTKVSEEQFVLDDEISNTMPPKRLAELSIDRPDIEKIPDSL